MIITYTLEQFEKDKILEQMQSKLDAMDLDKCNARITQIEGRLPSIVNPRQKVKVTERLRLIKIKQAELLGE